MHFLIALIGALAAAAGSAVLLARTLRMPRGDSFAWSAALLGLLISLGSQAMGYLAGFDSAVFRAMELFGQVVAPVAMAVALAEVAGRTVAARFCARLYLGALALVALVVLGIDQLSTASFSKAWPAPSVFYQTPPGIVLMFAIGPVTALTAVIAVAVVAARAGEPGWRDAIPGQLAGGGAALALAYPGLAQLAGQELHLGLPVAPVFTILCAIAALLGWLAGVLHARLPLAQMHGRADGPGERGGPPARRADPSRPAPPARVRPAGGPDRHAGLSAGDAGPAPARQPGRADLAVRSDLFGQIIIYTVTGDGLADFDRLTERTISLVRAREPDTLVFIAHGVPSAPTQRIFYQVFRSREAFHRHLTEPHIRQFEADRRPYVLTANVVELGLQQAKVSPFPSVTDLFGEPGFDTSGFERPDYLRDYGRDSAAQPGVRGLG